MPERKTVTIDVGPLYTRGDLVKAPEGASSKIRNCTLRRGQVEARPGFLYEATLAAATTPGRLMRGICPTNESLLYGGTTTKGAYRDSSAVWQAMTAGLGIGVTDYTVYKDKTWFCSYGDGSNAGSTASFDGATTFSNNATVTRVTGASIDTFIGRLFVGGPRFMHTTGGASLFDFDGAEWTRSGGPPTVSTEPSLLTIVNGTTDEIRTTSAAFTQGASEGLVTYVQWIRANVATASVPITLEIQNATTGAVYGSAEYFIQSSTAEPNWISYSVTALVPAATGVDLVLGIGNSASAATVGHTFYLGNSSANYGASVYPGHFIYPFGSIASVTATGYTAYTDRVYWSEPLDETDWRNENFAVCDETPGPITALRATKNKLIAFKRDALWAFRATSSAVAPILRENYIGGIGCISPRAIDVLDDVLIFVGENEVYIYDGAGYPSPIAGAAMKDELFDPTNLVASPVVAVDYDLREVWVHVQKYKIHIYSLEQQAWVGYYQLTDSSASETPFGTTYGQILDMVYMKPYNETYREMWVLFTNASGTNVICKLRGSQTQDNLDGTSRDVVKEYIFHALESPRPRKAMTVQTMGIDHRITASQSGSTTRYAVSLDNGNTFGKYNDVVLGVTTGADTDTAVSRVPVHQTAPRLVLKIQHTGLTGPAYFNISGAQADVILRGKEIQATNPTASSSSL